MIYSLKSSKHYHRIEILYPEYSNLNLIDLWLTYSRINAFVRVYFFLKKSRPDFLVLARFFIFYIFSIPIRLLKLTLYFLKSKENFRDTLINLILDSYDRVRGLKIETLNGKIYLNCNNMIKLSRMIARNNHLLDESTFCTSMLKLQQISRNFTTQEKSFGRVKVDCLKIYDSSGQSYVDIPHYTVIEKGTSIHATSNVNFKMKPNQSVDGIIPALTKPKSDAPGTVITREVSKVSTSYSRTLWVPKSEIANIKANYEEFHVDQSVREFLNEKEQSYCEVLRNDLRLGKNIDQDLVRSLRYNEFTQSLNSVTLEELRIYYDGEFKNNKID